MAQLNISKPVGDIAVNGTSPNANMFDDILVVQHLLNRSPGPGKPSPPLPEDGTLSPEVIAAICNYESFRGPVDGRIDPGDATMAALNAVALSEFEGVTDFLERRSIILRVNPDWNFTRGDFKTLVDMAGIPLRFDPKSVWLPNALKARLLTLFGALLKPDVDPSPTWGVSSLDWYHCHLGLWSGVPKQPISADSDKWHTAALGVGELLERERRPFTVFYGIPADRVDFYKAAYAAWVLSPDVALLLNSYADLPEAVMVHHTFEERDWRPTMKSGDPRRHWMVDAGGVVRTVPYRTANELNAAQNCEEFDLRRLDPDQFPDRQVRRRSPRARQPARTQRRHGLAIRRLARAPQRHPGRPASRDVTRLSRSAAACAIGHRQTLGRSRRRFGRRSCAAWSSARSCRRPAA